MKWKNFDEYVKCDRRIVVLEKTHDGFIRCEITLSVSMSVMKEKQRAGSVVKWCYADELANEVMK